LFYGPKEFACNASSFLRAFPANCRNQSFQVSEDRIVGNKTEKGSKSNIIVIDIVKKQLKGKVKFAIIDCEIRKQTIDHDAAAIHIKRHQQFIRCGDWPFLQCCMLG
jgi:hypothetical protein